MPIAFFDLDRTLLSVNSAELWVRHEYRGGRASRRQLGLAAWWLGLYRLGITQVETALEAGLLTLRGRLEEDLAQATRRFWEDEVQHHLRPVGREMVEHHRSRGHSVVLLTSSTWYLARLALEDLALDGCVCTRPEVVGGRFTGQVDGEFCFGKGKLRMAEGYARAWGKRLADAWFYTDSRADLPVLQAVGNPVCVNPDILLGRTARRLGWPVQCWDGLPISAAPGDR